MSTDTTPIAVGTTAPDFALKDQTQTEIRLSSYRGKKPVVLCFYPLDWSPVCTTENQCFTKDLSQFTAAGAEVLAISIDSTWSHAAFATANGFTHTLLADMHRQVCKAYGLYNTDLNTSQRATVIVDKNGKVAWIDVSPLGTARTDTTILAQLKTLTA